MSFNCRMAAVAATSAALLGSAVVWASPALADDTAPADPGSTTVIESGADTGGTTIVLIPATSSSIDPTEVDGTPTVEPTLPETSTAEIVVSSATSSAEVVIETLSPGTTVAGPSGEVIVLGPAVQGQTEPAAEPQILVAPAVEGESPGTTVVLPGEGDAAPTTIALGPARYRSQAPAQPVPAAEAPAAEVPVDAAPVDAAPAEAPIATAAVPVVAPTTAAAEIAVRGTSLSAPTTAAIEEATAVVEPTEVQVSQAAETSSAAADSDSPAGSVAAAAAVIAILGGGLLLVRRRVLRSL